MRFEDLNWMDVEEYLRHEDRVMLVLGATEQHGYLSLASDTLIPMALADAASKQTGVIVAPPLNFGVSPYFTTYPGTISLRVTTFVEVVADVVRSLHGYGFRRVLVVNGHGGNDPARGRLVELMNELPGLQVSWYSWWVSHSVEQVAIENGLKPYHAAWSEAFPFTRVADLPEGDKLPPAYKGLLDAERTREVFGDGVFGGRYQADDAVMSQVFNAALQDVLYLLDW
ncbi:MAG TPA: creatininase family protein [Anaerolineaceae bacterium]